MGHEEAIHLKIELQNMYVRAEGLMMKPKGVHPLENLLPEIDVYERLLHVCEDLQSSDIVPGTNWCKADIKREKSGFDVHAITWISHNEYQMNVRDTKTLSAHGSYISSSSVGSAKLKSRVKLKVASTAMQQEVTKVYETRLRAREFAEKKKQETTRKAQQAEQSALQELEMELLQIEQRTESELRLKEQELELTKVELEAWKDEVDPAVSTVTPNVSESCGPVCSNVCEIAPATSSKNVLQNARRSAQSSTHVTYTNVDYALNSTRMTKPTSHQLVRVSFSTRPINANTKARPLEPVDETPLKSVVLHQPRISFLLKGLEHSASSTSQAPLPISNTQSTTRSSLACGPSHFSSPPCPEVP